MADFQARRAHASDISELVRLRLVMLESLGAGDFKGPWENECAQILDRLLSRSDVTAFVVDHPDRHGRLVTSGIGLIEQRLPGPRNLTGRVGYVQSIATDSEFRRRGCARSVMSELMRWFAANDVTRVDLHASAQGEDLYRSLGFTEGDHVELSWRAPIA